MTKRGQYQTGTAGEGDSTSGKRRVRPRGGKIRGRVSSRVGAKIGLQSIYEGRWQWGGKRKAARKEANLERNRGNQARSR